MLLHTVAVFFPPLYLLRICWVISVAHQAPFTESHLLSPALQSQVMSFQWSDLFSASQPAADNFSHIIAYCKGKIHNTDQKMKARHRHFKKTQWVKKKFSTWSQIPFTSFSSIKHFVKITMVLLDIKLCVYRPKPGSCLTKKEMNSGLPSILCAGTRPREALK